MDVLTAIIDNMDARRGRYAKGEMRLAIARRAPLKGWAICEFWSGRRGSNPRPTAWEAVTLPLSYSRARRQSYLGER
jgi:hypothetical protein